MLRTQVSRPDLDDPTLPQRWRMLSRDRSPFLSWDWVGCLAAERYTDPVLIETFAGDRLAGLALFNRRRTRLGRSLYLHETGDPAWDSVFIEHNGVAAAADEAASVLAATLRAAMGVASRVVLNGIDDAGLAIARGAGLVARLHTRAAPVLHLGPGGALLPQVSRNTRAQLRRSARAYEAFGPIAVERAASAVQALDWLDRLLPLHAATWAARGITSGFTAHAVQQFHRAMIGTGVTSGTVAMLRVSAGSRVIGYLYNLDGPAGMAVYQSGFDYAGAPPHGKPGLTCHAAAIEQAWAGGEAEYDFLAGDSQYKRSLAHGVRDLHWLELCRPGSLAGAEARLRRLLGR